jgi:hypothetical protein
MTDSVAGATIAAVAGATIAATAAILGLIITNFLTTQRENRTKKLQLAIEHAEKQISELYSPLMELVEELDAFAEVAPSSDGLSDQTKQYVSVELYDKFFMPIHEKIVTILNTKMHLVEGWEIPPSFLRFLRHYTGQKVEAALRKVEVPKGEKVVVNPIGYPPQFYWDVRNGLIKVSKRYERFLLDARKDLKSLKSISDSETVQQVSYSKGEIGPCRK